MAQTIGGGVLNPLNPKVRGAAASAGKLTAAHTIQTDLGSGAAAGFDGSKDVTPGVKGVLPVANGGTGASTAEAALAALGGTPSNGRVKVYGFSFNNTSTSVPGVTVDKTLWENCVALQPNNNISICEIYVGYNNSGVQNSTFHKSLPEPDTGPGGVFLVARYSNRGFMLYSNFWTNQLWHCAVVNDTPGEWKKIV